MSSLTMVISSNMKRELKANTQFVYTGLLAYHSLETNEVAPITIAISITCYAYFYSYLMIKIQFVL